MKKLLATSTFLLVGLVAFSQPGHGRPDVTAEQIAQRQANALSQHLTLSEEQRSKVYSVYLDAAKKELVAREARMKEMQKLHAQDSIARKQRHDKINQLLTAEQKTKFGQKLKARGLRGGGPGVAQNMRRGTLKQGGALGFRQGGPGVGTRGPRFQGPKQGRPNGPQMQQGPRQMMHQGRPMGPQMQQGPRQQMQGGPGQGQDRPDFQGRPRPNGARPGGPQQQFKGRPNGPGQRQGPPPPPPAPNNDAKPAEPAK